ncbi:MAG: radical SAM protein [Lachnospiraceae bacterium]|nr:radical SAM protein [Lachnospiraceae bacterium]
MARKIEVTTRMGCKVNCRYCPQKLALEKYFAADKKRESVLSFEKFREYLDKIPRDVQIIFSGMCEPWLNAECTDMVEYAARDGREVDIYTTLVGMNHEDYRRIRNLKLHYFVLHVADKDNNATIPVTEEYKSLLKEIVEGHKSGRLPITSISVHGQMHPEICDIMKEAEGVPVLSEIYDRAGNLESDEGVTISQKGEKKGSLCCTKCNGFSLDDNYLLPDGTMLVCPMDWGLEYELGTLETESYEEISEGKVKQEFRKRMRSSKYGPVLCRHCHVSQPELAYRASCFFYGLKQTARKLLKGDKTEMKQAAEGAAQNRAEEVPQYAEGVLQN